MRKQTKKKCDTPVDPAPTPPPPAPVPPKPVSVQQDQERRMAACGEAIRKVLAEHRCEILAQIDPNIRPVGTFGEEVIVRATWAIGAHP